MKPLKAFLFLIMCFPLTGCFSSENKGSTGPTEDHSRLVIERIHSYGVVDFDHIFTNGGISEYTATYYDKNGVKFDESIDTSVDWWVENRNLASVDSGGHVTGKKNGVTKLIGQYRGVRGEITLDILTIAKTFEQTEPLAEYRTSHTYDFPLNISPSTASIDYTFSEDNIIRINSKNHNRFDVVGVGSVTVTATAVTHWSGHTTTYNFVINTMNENAPVFYLNNKPSTSTTFSCAKNRYSEIPYEAMGLTAKDANGNDITSSIAVSNGEYDLTTEGTYNLTLSIKDNLFNLTSYFDLTLVVGEYDEKKTLSPIDAVNCDQLEVTYDKPQPTYRTFNSVTITATVSLNSKYFCSDGVVHVGAYIHAKYWGGSYFFDDNFETTYQMSKDGPTTVTLTASWSKSSSVAYEGLELVPSIYLVGYCYEKITY